MSASQSARYLDGCIRRKGEKRVELGCVVCHCYLREYCNAGDCFEADGCSMLCRSAEIILKICETQSTCFYSRACIVSTELSKVEK